MTPQSTLLESQIEDDQHFVDWKVPVKEWMRECFQEMLSLKVMQQVIQGTKHTSPKLKAATVDTSTSVFIVILLAVYACKPLKMSGLFADMGPNWHFTFNLKQ